MSKNPFQQISLGSALGNLWAGTLFGILGLYFCLEQTPYFVWQASPVLTSLIFSIPAVYLTAKSIPHGLKAWL
jgi:membrane glycosyltransferase